MASITQEIRPGDTVQVKRKVIEGDKERIQLIEGKVIARKHGKQSGATITVRKIASGVGVEFIFPIHSPQIEEIKVTKRAKVRRAKLYYLRQRSGKASRMKNEVVVEVVKKSDKKDKKEKKESKLESKSENQKIKDQEKKFGKKEKKTKEEKPKESKNK